MEVRPGCRVLRPLLFVCLLVGVLREGAVFGGQPEFVATQVHQATEQVYGLAWGDFDPVHEGMEVACLTQSGSVLQVSPVLCGWEVALRHAGETNIRGMWDRPTICIGDVHSGHQGNEVVTCGGAPSLITMLFYDPNGGWSHEGLFDNTGMIGGSWGARVGNFDPRRCGEEILHMYETLLDMSTGSVFGEVAGVWEDEFIWGSAEWVEVGMDSAAGEFNPDHAGPEIVVVTEMGPAYEIVPPEGNSPVNWPRQLIWDDGPNSGWVVEIADVEPCHPGNEIVYGTRYSNRIMMSHHNGEGLHEIQVLLTGNALERPWPECQHHNNMWDIAVGDVLPDNDGLEILGVDHTGSVYLVGRVGDNWQRQVIWQDPNNPLYAIIAGDFLPARRGDEVLVAGESGIITLLALKFTDFTGDGMVNLQDFAELAGYWGQNEPSVDVAPWPYGDGTVNMLDLAVLTDSWLANTYCIHSNFTGANYIVVDDMESYNQTSNLIYDTWEDGFVNDTGSVLDLGEAPSDPVHGGCQSMKYMYDNKDSKGWEMDYYSEVALPITDPCDWREAGVNILTLFFYGQAGNDANATEQMYAGLADGRGESSYAQVNYGKYEDEDMNDIKVEEWHQWDIALSDFNGVDLNDLSKLYIGFGIRGNLYPDGTPGGTGMVYFEDIRLYRPKCVRWRIKPDTDFTDDCIADLVDLGIMADEWLTAGLKAGLLNDNNVDFRTVQSLQMAGLRRNCGRRSNRCSQYQ